MNDCSSLVFTGASGIPPMLRTSNSCRVTLPKDLGTSINDSENYAFFPREITQVKNDIKIK